MRKNHVLRSYLLLLIITPSFLFASPYVTPLSFFLRSPTRIQSTNNILLSASCDSSGLNCTAIGYSDGIPLSYTTTNGGTSWNIPVLLTPPQTSGSSILVDIACDNQGVNCIATGTSVDTNNGTMPLTYTTTNSGTTWSSAIQPSPPQNASQNALTGISCDSKAQNCISIGYSGNPESFMPLGYISSDGGTTWNNTGSFQSPTTANSLILIDIACDNNVLNCLTIGFMTTSSSFQSLIYQTTDGGSTWQAPTSAPAPENSTNNILTSLACDNTITYCITVGATLINNSYAGLLYRSSDGGATWGQPTLLNAPDNSYGSGLSDIVCDSSGKICTAVGYYVASDTTMQSLSYNTTDGGTTWSTPTLLTTPSGNAPTNLLFNLTCDSSMQNCLTVGVATGTGLSNPISYNSTNSGINWSNPTILAVP